MPILKFETKLINGRPNIVFETERQQNTSKKRNYKTKVQKCPLRNVGGKNSDEANEDISHVNVARQEKAVNDSYKSQRRSFSSSQNQNTNFDIYDISNKRRVADQSNIKESNSKKESLFNFLKTNKTENINNGQISERKSRKRDIDREKKSLSDDDIDDIMKEVVLKNKDILSDDQLVDLLAKIYIEAKRIPKDDVHVIHREPDKSDHRRDDNIKEDYKFVPTLEIGNNEKNVTKESSPKMSENPLPLTMAQKKQLQWEQERQELAKITSYNPWGRPGCGAPPRDSFDISSNDNLKSTQNDSRIYVENSKPIPSARNPEPSGLSQAEIKRRQWVAELNEQVAEKERTKFQSNSQQPQFYDYPVHDSGDTSPGHGRGKGLANLNQVTSEELNLKRHKQMEQQEAIKRQIEEKELIKRLEREKKALLDQQEEMRINKEKQLMDSQYMSETARVKQKEDESGRRFALLRSQVEEAERAALLEKRMKRLQHLELAGHDTRQLRAGLVSDQMTGQLAASTEFIPQETSYSNVRPDKEWSRNGYNRSVRKGYPLTEDQGIQTDIEEEFLQGHYHDNDTSRSRKEYRNKSVDVIKEDKKVARKLTNYKMTEIKNHEGNIRKQEKKQFRVPSATYTKQEEKPKSKRPESIGSRKPWGVKKINKQYVPQSKRDPFYMVNKNERESNKNERVNKILAQVRANLNRIPDTDIADGHLSQRHKRCDDRRVPDHDKENVEFNQGTYDLRDGNVFRLDDDNDRVQASVRYKDSYRQQGVQERSHRGPTNPSQRNAWTPNNQSDMWEDTDHEIVRTTDILDPSVADRRCLVSREDTGRERARQSYFRSQNPGQLGDNMDNNYISVKQRRNDQSKNDPLSYPPTHPTNRQNTILKQLSDIREDLRMRQKDIETSLSFNGEY